ncbi:hypothetical protein C2E23DRAFT_804030 [Lenzites betulinus]|nr:hypothetical protein C2E23DRAFT_804030 [Lenzites betulinus]
MIIVMPKKTSDSVTPYTGWDPCTRFVKGSRILGGEMCRRRSVLQYAVNLMRNEGRSSYLRIFLRFPEGVQYYRGDSRTVFPPVPPRTLPCDLNRVLRISRLTSSLQRCRPYDPPPPGMCMCALDSFLPFVAMPSA